MLKIISYDYGHGVGNDRGAEGVLNEEKVVRDYGSKCIEYLTQAGYTCINCTPSDNQGYTLSQSLVYRTDHANASGSILHLCFHANAFQRVDKPMGTEIEIAPVCCETSQKVAQSVLTEICKLGFTNRGINRPNLWVTKNTNMSCILCEPFFVDSSFDCNLYNADKMGRAVAQGVLNVLGGSIPNNTPSQPSTPIPEDTWRVFIDDKQVIALTGKNKSLTYAQQQNGIEIYIENVRTSEKIVVKTKPIDTPKDYEKEVCRILVNGKSDIALTGKTKCINYAKDNCVGHIIIQCVSDNKNIAEFDVSKPITPEPIPTPTPIPQPQPIIKHLVMGTSECTVDQCETFLHKLYPNAPYYADIYKEEAEKEGVRFDFSFAQSIKETGYFQFKDCISKKEWNNMSGIGVTGVQCDDNLLVEKPFIEGVIELKTADGRDAGVKFATPQLGIKAQIQHEKAYSSTEALKDTCVDPRYNLVIPKGMAIYIEDYGSGIWASDTNNYGGRIYEIMQQIKNTVAEEQYKKPIDKPTDKPVEEPTNPIEQPETKENDVPVVTKISIFDMLYKLIKAFIEIFKK